MEKEKVSPAKAIRSFFEADGGRKLTVAELKELTVDERMELAYLAADALGVEIELRTV